MGHLNLNDLSLLGTRGMVSGLPHMAIPKKVCDNCLISKQTRKKFSF